MRLIKIPYNAGCLGKNIGTEKAPDAVTAGFLSKYLAKAETVDIKVNNSNINDSMAAIKGIKKGDIIIGGDHSITYKCFIESGCDGIIIFDAHADLMDSKLTHEDWLRNLITEGKIKKENIIIIALRNVDSSEMEFIRHNKIRCYFMQELFNNMEEVCDIVMEIAREWKSLYLSVDIDAVDPSMAPGTGYIEAGGLSSHELLYFLHRIKRLKNLYTTDLVEINPDKDVNSLTISLGAGIIDELSRPF